MGVRLASIRRSGFTLIELMVVVAIIGAISAIALAGFLQIRRMANEKNASTSMKSILTGEELFRNNDADRNQVNDYWTFDLTGLFNMRPTVGGSRVLCISDMGIAQADLDPMAAGVYDNTVMEHPGPEGSKQPKTGYWYQSMVNDVTALPLVQVTDGTGVACHNFGRWAFCALPATYGVSGAFCFILSEDATVFKSDFGTNMPAIPSPPARVSFAPLDTWPDSPTLANSWSRVE